MAGFDVYRDMATGIPQFVIRRSDLLQFPLNDPAFVAFNNALPTPDDLLPHPPPAPSAALIADRNTFAALKAKAQAGTLTQADAISAISLITKYHGGF